MYLSFPALWFHTTKNLAFSVGFNVFWKHLPPNLYDPKDLYGNRDLLPARDALQVNFNPLDLYLVIFVFILLIIPSGVGGTSEAISVNGTKNVKTCG